MNIFLTLLDSGCIKATVRFVDVLNLSVYMCKNAIFLLFSEIMCNIVVPYTTNTFFFV